MPILPPHNSVVIPWRVGRDWALQVYLLQCIPNQPPPPEEEIRYSHKIPGGKAKILEDELPKEVWETPEQTGKRELREESGLKVKAKIPLELVCEFPMPGHTKYVFSIARSKCHGRFHKSYRDESRTRIVGGKWFSIDEAIQLMEPDGANRSQYEGLLKFKEQQRGLLYKGLNVA